jgi:hypothetical protein
MTNEPLTDPGFWALARTAGISPNPNELDNDVVTCSTREGQVMMIENPRNLTPEERRHLLQRLLARVNPFGH